MRFFLLLCADLGLRHRTAAAISLRNYNPKTHSLTFITKGKVQQTMPLTPALEELFESLPEGTPHDQPIVNLLRHRSGLSARPYFNKQWRALKRRLGVRQELRVHDLRRTAAELAWSATHDVRKVQAFLGHRSPITTARYLANRIGLEDLRPVLDAMQQTRTVAEYVTPQMQHQPPEPTREEKRAAMQHHDQPVQETGKCCAWCGEIHPTLLRTWLIAGENIPFCSPVCAASYQQAKPTAPPAAGTCVYCGNHTPTPYRPIANEGSTDQLVLCSPFCERKHRAAQAN